jgi:hypothetical protein
MRIWKCCIAESASTRAPIGTGEARISADRRGKRRFAKTASSIGAWKIGRRPLDGFPSLPEKDGGVAQLIRARVTA